MTPFHRRIALLSALLALPTAAIVAVSAAWAQNVAPHAATVPAAPAVAAAPVAPATVKHVAAAPVPSEDNDAETNDDGPDNDTETNDGPDGNR
jgi:hypothetical protein